MLEALIQKVMRLWMDESLLKKLELQITPSIQQGLSLQKNHHQ